MSFIQGYEGQNSFICFYRFLYPTALIFGLKRVKNQYKEQSGWGALLTDIKCPFLSVFNPKKDVFQTFFVDV